jgi:hypothetical protein
MGEQVIGPDRHDVRKIKSILINSYRFSRGSLLAQHHFLQYIGEHFDFAFSNASYEAAFEPTFEVASSITRNHKEHPRIPKNPVMSADEVRDKYRRELKDVFDVLRTSSQTDPDPQHSLEVARFMLSVDYKWAPNSSHESHLAVRPYTSNLYWHGVAQNNTGHPMYDQLYRESAETLVPNFFESMQGDYMQSVYTRMLSTISADHIRTHPESFGQVNAYLGRLAIEPVPLEQE